MAAPAEAGKYLTQRVAAFGIEPAAFQVDHANMPNDLTTELLLAGVGAGVGLLFGVTRFLARPSGSRRMHRPRMKRRRRLGEAVTYVPRPFAEVEHDYELIKTEFAVREEHHKILRSAFAPDPCAIQVGDTVVYAFKDVPERLF